MIVVDDSHRGIAGGSGFVFFLCVAERSDPLQRMTTNCPSRDETILWTMLGLGGEQIIENNI